MIHSQSLISNNNEYRLFKIEQKMDSKRAKQQMLSKKSYEKYEKREKSWFRI